MLKVMLIAAKKCMMRKWGKTNQPTDSYDRGHTPKGENDIKTEITGTTNGPKMEKMDVI